MPITLQKTLANIPEIARGYGYVMNADSKKGPRLVYCNKKSVYLRSLEDPSVSKIYAGEHKANVIVAKASPNGEWIASGDANGTMLIWGQGNQMMKGEPRSVNKGVLDIDWDADGKRIAVAGEGASVTAWDTGSAIGSIGGQAKKVLSVSYKKTRPYRIITGGEDMNVFMHEGPPFKFGKTIKDHSNFVNKCKYSPDGEKFISVSSDRKICCYEAKTGDKIKEIGEKDTQHTGSIYSFAWSPDSQKILTCGADKVSKVWNVETGALETTFTYAEKPQISDMQMCAVWEGDYMITISLSGAINYLDPANPSKPKKIVMGHAGSITSLVSDVASGSFYSADVNGVVCKWSPEGEATWFTGKGHGKAVVCIALNDDGSKLATCGFDDKVRVSDCKTMELEDAGVPLGGAPKCCAFGKNDLLVVGTSKDVLVVVSGDSTSTVKVPSTPLSLGFSADGSKLAVGMHKGGAQVFDVSGDGLKLAYALTTLNKRVTTVSWKSDGKLAIGGDDRQILVMDGETQLNKSDWQAHNGGVTGVQWNPSGSCCLSVSADLTLFVWKDMEKFGMTREKHMMSHREGVTTCAWVSDDTFVTVGCDECIKVWKVEL